MEYVNARRRWLEQDELELVGRGGQEQAGNDVSRIAGPEHVNSSRGAGYRGKSWCMRTDAHSRKKGFSV
jgi:hypothetical protein